ncbi:MAG: hypothetical protein F4Z72_11525 [Gemmatimonadales bacterium]|nr:hypothetical protein [Candidatus Palauibacter irciniicola]MYC19027.1 hypothetical protein [Gemmatimonadales bacterium]
MNAERLLTLYDRVADAPDAVGRLRRFVLDLAVRGKLVVQDPTDESASELSESVARSRISNSDLPRNWCSVAVGDILEFKYGKGLKASDREEHGPVPVYGSNGIVGYTVEPLTARPSVIVGRKGSAGALNKCDGPSWTTDVAYYVEAPDFFDLEFLFLSLATLDLNELARGVKPGLSRADAYAKLIRVPPLGEQGRIVAKVDELMTLCDRLDEARTAREDTRNRLTQASHFRLTATDADAPTFWPWVRFAVNAFPALTSRADQVQHLRQTILNLAVCGRLVEQDPSDEPASESLQRIEIIKRELVKAKVIRRPKRLPDLDTSQLLFTLPHSWCWARLDELSPRTLTDGDWIETKDQSKDGNVRLIQLADVGVGAFLNKSARFVTEETEARLRCTRLTEGDVLIARLPSPIGRACIFPDVGQPAITAVDVAILRADENSYNRYIEMAINAPSTRAQIEAYGKGATRFRVSTGHLKTVVLPLPPVAEQRRIVTKVDKLMTLCDRLEAGLDGADIINSRLLDSLLHESLHWERRT